MIKTYTVNFDRKRDYENGFHLTCEHSRIGKLMAHLEVYKKVLGLAGDVLEFGIYKGTSFMRLVSFRELLENQFSRKIIGFDAFGKFPSELSLESDQKFVEKFESAGGLGISKEHLDVCLNNKGVKNYELVAGDICETLPAYIDNNKHLKIALIHIDVDVYEPSKVILENLWDRVVPNGVLMLDDYALVEGETRAIDEFFKNEKIIIEKTPYCYNPSFIIKK